MIHQEVIHMLKQRFFSMGINNKQLVQNMAEWLRKDIDSIRVVLWPPKVEELEQEELPPLIIKLSALKGKKGLDISPNTLALTFFIPQYVSKKPTTTAINATITLHGITGSKELIDSLYELGMGSLIQMCYFYVIFGLCMILNSTLHVCSDEINEGEPSISIIDNDDFKWHFDWWRHCTLL